MGAPDYPERSEVQAFIRELVTENEFDEGYLMSVFRQAEYKQSIIDAISRPAEKTLTWAEYQDIFLTEDRTKSGVKFMTKNQKSLDAAYKTYGVPPEIVTAIIGVENHVWPD